MLERWASSRSTQRETVPEPQQGKRETSTHDEEKLSRPVEQRLRAINRPPEIVGKLFGIEYQTAANAKFVATNIDCSLRREHLSWHHHKEVAGRDDKEDLKDDPECLALYREAMKGEPGRPEKGCESQPIKTEKGTGNKAYTCERLKRDVVIGLRRLRSTSRNDGIWRIALPFS